MKNKVAQILSPFLILSFLLIITAEAAPPLTQYAPNETLDPDCAPEDINCSIDLGWTFDSVNNYVYNLGKNIGINTITPTSLFTIKGTDDSFATKSFSLLNDSETEVFSINNSGGFRFQTSLPSTATSLLLTDDGSDVIGTEGVGFAYLSGAELANFGAQSGASQSLPAIALMGVSTQNTTQNNNVQVRSTGVYAQAHDADGNDSIFFLSSTTGVQIRGYNTGQTTALRVINDNAPSADTLLRVFNNGQVTINDGDDIPTDILTVGGDIRLGTGTSASSGCVKDESGTQIAGTCSSDIRFKESITPLENVLEKWTTISPSTFYWRADEFPQHGFDPNFKATGLIAQDVEKFFPELVETDTNGFKAVKYQNIPLYNMEAIKELYQYTKRLEERIIELENQR